MLKIGVLLGGCSAEREVSLKTGEAIYNALINSGYDAVKIDVNENIAEELKLNKVNVAFIALHGKWGEDGIIQGLLELLNIPYTGSGVLASSLCIDKITTKKILIYESLPTPDFLVVEKNEVNQEGIDLTVEKFKTVIELPVVVKAPTQGSTIGTSFVYKFEDLGKALLESFKYDDNVLIEELIDGIEITASILGNKEPEALPLIEIVSSSGVYDYKAKYTVGMSNHIIPPRIPEDKQNEIKSLALRTYKALGCKGLARVDFMLSNHGVPFILEVNTIPGMTETSLFPDAAKQAGISFNALVEKLLKLALEGKKNA